MEMLANVRLTDGRTDVFGYSSGGEGDKQQRNQYKHQAATERALASPRENGSTTFHNYRPKYPQKIVHAISLRQPLASMALRCIGHSISFGNSDNSTKCIGRFVRDDIAKTGPLKSIPLDVWWKIFSAACMWQGCIFE